MNELITKFAPKDADNQKIVAAILANAVCSLVQNGADAPDALKAVAETYAYFLTSSPSDSGSCLAVWEALRNN